MNTHVYTCKAICTPLSPSLIITRMLYLNMSISFCSDRFVVNQDEELVHSRFLKTWMIVALKTSSLGSVNIRIYTPWCVHVYIYIHTMVFIHTYIYMYTTCCIYDMYAYNMHLKSPKLVLFFFLRYLQSWSSKKGCPTSGGICGAKAIPEGQRVEWLT